jgi:putative OPT family oligopeptide transporter
MNQAPVVDAPSRAPASGAPPTAQMTLRAVATGMVFGGVLSLCNIYTGLKIGWLMGMSMTAALLSFGFWQLVQVSSRGRNRGLTMLETNISQTAASAAASIGAAGLVAPIPALTMLTGQTLSWGALVMWTFSVCLVGIAVSIGLRKQLIEVENLPFPSGSATANTLREIYSHGGDALVRLRMLGGAALLAAVVKFIEFFAKLGKPALPGWFKSMPGGGLEKAGVAGYGPANLGFSFDPTLMMYGVGVLVGPRVGISVLLGSILAWGILGPLAFESGWVPPGPAGGLWYNAGLQWLLWPGVALMVTAALTSFAFSWRTFLSAFLPAKTGSAPPPTGSEIMPRRWFILMLVAVTAISVILQTLFFNIGIGVAVLGVLLTFLLALVATRVSGETNVTPVTAMGKVTQLAFAVLAPGNPAANLMSANVTGGAASQCADMMHDLKTGHMIGANPKPQFVAQVLGAFAGALVGCAGYLILVRDPLKQLLTPEWPAPSVAAWKSVAELFMHGAAALPTGAVEGMIIGAAAGVLLAVMEKLLPPASLRWVPSATSVGLAFVIPANSSISLFVGSMVAYGSEKLYPRWSARYLVIIASGIIAGESLSGMVLAAVAIFTGD